MQGLPTEHQNHIEGWLTFRSFGILCSPILSYRLLDTAQFLKEDMINKRDISSTSFQKLSCAYLATDVQDVQ